MIRFEEIREGEWYWFWSNWHGRVVMGQVLEKFSPAPQSNLCVVFHKVVETNGQKASWAPDDQTSVSLDDIVKIP